jgi:hypothetical protein
MRATHIYRVAFSWPPLARMSVPGRVRRLQRRLVPLPYYVGRERCAYSRFSVTPRPTLNRDPACLLGNFFSAQRQ